MKFISKVLRDKRQNSTTALIPFITAGYPNIDLTIKAIFKLDAKGADIIELGIPYSDALADGPLIQEASSVAIKQGVSMEKVLDILAQVKGKLSSPIVIFTYYNLVLVRGVNNFITELSKLGVKGIVIPDLPIEETDHLIKICSMHELELISFVAPTSSKARINNIISKAPGCIYLVSSTGVTGMRQSINTSIAELSKYIFSKTNKPVMLGFGISSPSQIRNLLKSGCYIDGLVVGSAFTSIMSNNNNDIGEKVINDLGKFCEKMKEATLLND
uniref:Tryptophan synthase alpha chain n=1 Tax=Polysiphonia scopulorum TaxID=257860 RepID=A0A1Z1MIG8_9FLOR|nr:Tryptophan synthase alpha subunit [Polysiphonia scopulorum]ARW65534.1 Tryptophan synthase alpha subunit [Polysiphonia scopulorum]